MCVAAARSARDAKKVFKQGGEGQERTRRAFCPAAECDALLTKLGRKTILSVTSTPSVHIAVGAKPSNVPHL
eukprot:scaffold6180_cov200-Pinguiococcus_pyrenoidosus.AAC.3